MLDDARPVSDDEDAAALRGRVAASVRDHRARDGSSLADLAAAAGIGKSTLHAIESGDANPSIETLWSLARALDVPFGELLDPPPPPVRVLRAGEGPKVAAGEGVGLVVHLLASTSRGARTELYRMALEPGPARTAAGHTTGTIEHVLAIAGRVRVGPVDASVELGVGDLATFPGDVAHRYDALEPGTEMALLLEYP